MDMGMGLDMKKILTSLLLISVLASASCMKKQDLDSEDLGPAVASVELTKALASGFGPYDYNDIKTNEFNNLLLTVRIQDTVTQPLEQQGITIQKKTDSADKISLELLVQTEIYSDENSSSGTRQWNIDLRKVGSLSKTTDPEPPNLMFKNFEYLAFGSCFNEGEFAQTCHRLNSEDIRIKVPRAAIAQHNCPDPSNCTIAAKKIEFDRVLTTQFDDKGKPIRTHFSMILSREVPFMSRLLQLCMRGVHKLGNPAQEVVAEQCYTVNNYAFGQ